MKLFGDYPMEQCPFCGSDLQKPAVRTSTRPDDTTGQKNTTSELVSCPDCDEIIDGFSPH